MTQLPGDVDYVVVGAGSSGCVIASRLSEDPKSRVLLVEAGPDFPPGEEPADILDTFPRSMVPKYYWPGLMVEAANGTGPQPYAQARLVGGGSCVTGLVSLRGAAADYAEWEASGAAGWGWDEMLPWFRRIEQDHDIVGAMHGEDGPFAIERVPITQWPPFCAAVAKAAKERGEPFLQDMNDGFNDGFGSVPLAKADGHRQTAASTYLTADVRARANLTILADTSVDVVLFEGRRAVGVRMKTAGKDHVATAREVVIAAGAVHTPTLLMRSGIGPAADLLAAGITPVVAREGVGANLFDHSLVTVTPRLHRDAVQPDALHAASICAFRYSSGVAGTSQGDLFVSVLNQTAPNPAGKRTGALMSCLYKPSSRGRLALDPGHPSGEPIVRFNLLGDEVDVRRHVVGLQFCAELMRHRAIRAVADTAFLPTSQVLVGLVTREDWIGRLASRAATLMLDAPGPIRHFGISLAGQSLSALMQKGDQAALNFVRDHAIPCNHVGGTCRMGRVEDPMAVVDPECKLIGVDGVRVADCSIMPTPVSANTNLTAMVIGERAANFARSR